MKITGLSVDLIELPFAVPYKLSKAYGTLTHAGAVIVRLETDDGLVGLGEANPTPPFTEETPGGVFAALGDHIWPAIKGADATSVNAVLDRIDLALAGNHVAKGAVDMALHDLAGKALCVPCHRLLGGQRHDALKVLWPLGSGSAEDDRPVIEQKIAEGYRCFMLKMGARPVGEEIGRLEALFSRHGDGLDVIVDANQGWSRAEALDFARRAEAFPLRLIEQPVAAADHDGLAQVRAAARQPVSADESIQTVDDARALLARGAVDVFSIKISKNGGFREARRIAALAETDGVDCLMNSMLECGVTQAASLQLGAVLGNLMDIGHAYMSTLRLADDVTDFAGLVRDGVVAVPQGPGLGISLDQTKLDKYSVRHERHH